MMCDEECSSLECKLIWIKREFSAVVFRLFFLCESRASACLLKKLTLKSSTTRPDQSWAEQSSLYVTHSLDDMLSGNLILQSRGPIRWVINNKVAGADDEERSWGGGNKSIESSPQVWISSSFLIRFHLWDSLPLLAIWIVIVRGTLGE